MNSHSLRDIAKHIFMSRLEMFTLFGDAFLSMISYFASPFTHEPTNMDVCIDDNQD